MDLNSRLAISYYKTVANIDEKNGIYVAQHCETNKIYIKKILNVYNRDIYQQLYSNPIPGIPHIYAIYEGNNILTVIEEYISGDTLQDKIKSGEINSDNMILSYIIQLCDILNSLHNCKTPIIHRDIKPSNIIITPDNCVRLIDFNAAKYLNEKQNKDTILLGTEGYAAPEQYGFGASNCQTDIYAVGILMQELYMSVHSDSQLPIAINNIIQRCTQMNPHDRYNSAYELKKELTHLQNVDNEHSQAILKNKVPNDRKINNKKSISSFIIPGFRKKVPWHMFVATFGYVLIFWLSLTISVENVSTGILWYERIFLLIMMLSIVFVSCDYMNIHNLFPAWICKNKVTYIVGIVLINIIISVFFITIMLIGESIVS